MSSSRKIVINVSVDNLVEEKRRKEREKKMKIREILNLMQTGTAIVNICGTYQHGIVSLYKGDVDTLRQVLKINDIMESKNWGGIDENKCFLLRDIDTISSSSGRELFVSIQMPDTYTHKDKDGNRLDEYISLG